MTVNSSILKEPATDNKTKKLSPVARFFLRGITWYKKTISVRTTQKCRYYPTCSTYSVTVIERFGAIKGLWLSIKRIARCNPFFPGGIDDPPEKSPAGHNNDFIKEQH